MAKPLEADRCLNRFRGLGAQEAPEYALDERVNAQFFALSRIGHQPFVRIDEGEKVDELAQRAAKMGVRHVTVVATETSRKGLLWW